jgi:Cd2+/Zn2+-exporting ATPase
MRSNLICERARVGQSGPMAMTSAGPAVWTEDLIRFLQSQPGVAAVRVNPLDRTVALATLGPVDVAAIEAQLAIVLRAVEKRVDESKAAAARPAGYVLRSDAGVTTIERPTCPTAPSLWLWRAFTWPEVSAPEPTTPEWRFLAVLAGVCGAGGLAAFALGHLAAVPAVALKALYFIALVAGGWDAAVDTWENLRQRKVDIHFLMLAVAVGAVSIGAWGEAVLLLFLFSASGAMEEYALDRTHREVSALLHTAPKLATVIGPDGAQHVVKAEQLQVDDRLLVKPGDMFAADGEVVKGQSASDESTLTGESVPVDKTVGAQVFSGTINLTGVLEVRVRRLPAESTLQKIIRLIQTAQKLKAPSERFTDKFGAGYTLAVLGLTAAMFLVWWQGLGIPAFQNEPGRFSAFYRAMTLLVVASPCALVLSIPSAILAAIAWGAKHGILFRGGGAIEKLAEVDVVALDKTGTLTTGELAVVSCESFPAGREKEVLELAYALERNSTHPIARAISRHARQAGARARDVEQFESITGQGVRGRLGDGNAVLGRRELIAAGPFAEWLEKMPPAAAEFSEVWVLAAGLLGRLLLKDQLRPESREVLATLKARGITTVMLTGDRRHTAESVARELGVDEVRSGLSPADKVAAVDGFRQEGRKVAMVGDGVNDAPCLAAAYVSVAMGARASDAALEQSEIVLMNDRIENFLSALQLSRRARGIIRENLVISLGTVIVMVTTSLFGVVPLTIGVLMHEGSTVVVCLNSLRLLFGKNR